ncbi:MAG: hypothetical protein WCR67_01660 [Bacilli bacterium]
MIIGPGLKNKDNGLFLVVSVVENHLFCHEVSPTFFSALQISSENKDNLLGFEFEKAVYPEDLPLLVDLSKATDDANAIPVHIRLIVNNQCV